MTSTPPTAPSAVRDLFPGIFATVMATGICAVGAGQQGLRPLAVGLHGVAVAMYAVLAVLLVARAVRHPRRLWQDLTSHERGFAYLTCVAATNVLADGFGLLYGQWRVAAVLGLVSLPLWCVLVYATLGAVIVGSRKPGLERGINGTWFLLTVSTQSVAVVAALLLADGGHDLLAFAALAAFGLGVVLYLIVMTMVFLRWTFLRLSPHEPDPPAWIAAGAVAITVLAGADLLLAADEVPRLARVAPFLEGIVVTAWATSTFWFPLMLVISAWRYVVRRKLLRYEPAYWSMVFPLGMYAVATFQMLEAIDLGPLGWLPPVAFGIALAAWAPTFGGLLRRVVRRDPAAVCAVRRPGPDLTAGANPL